MMPKISIIITTYNRKEYLGETVRSILNQTYQDYEIIIVDNFSNYDFFEYINSFKNNKIIPFQNHNNGVIAVNRNFGIQHARGEFLAFCDDDDIWFKNKLEEQILVLKKTKCDLVYSNIALFKYKTTNLIKNTNNKKIYSLKGLINKNQVNTSTVLVRNSDIFFPEDPNLIAVEDYALWLRLCKNGFYFEFIPKALVYFRISDFNISKQMWAIKHLKLVYLYVSLLINSPELPIKFIVLKKIFINYLKYLLKSFIINDKYLIIIQHIKRKIIS